MDLPIVLPGGTREEACGRKSLSSLSSMTTSQLLIARFADNSIPVDYFPSSVNRLTDFETRKKRNRATMASVRSPSPCPPRRPGSRLIYERAIKSAASCEVRSTQREDPPAPSQPPILVQKPRHHATFQLRTVASSAFTSQITSEPFHAPAIFPNVIDRDESESLVPKNCWCGPCICARDNNSLSDK